MNQPVSSKQHVEDSCTILPARSKLSGKRMAVVSFSAFPGDPRPRRAAEAFVEAGMSVEVICLQEEGNLKREMLKGIQIDRLGITKTRNSKFGYVFQYVLFLLTAFMILALRFPARRYDVVHIHNMPDVLVFAALVPKLFGAKVILDLHDPMPELMMTIFNVDRESFSVKLMVMLEKWSTAFADVVLTVNRACEKLFSSRSCCASKICVIMNSPDEAIFNYAPVERGCGRAVDLGRPFVIMYHGTLVERNGVDLAVEALEKARQSFPGVELRIYGPRTPFLDRVLRSVDEKNLGRWVMYLGARRLEQLSEAIAECDVGVIPNRRSIFTEINTPTRIFEYLAVGKPVLAPRAPGIQDYFNENELVYFNLGDAGDLATKLVWIATHPSEAADIASRGQAVYLKHTWSEEKKRLLMAAGRLINEGG